MQSVAANPTDAVARRRRPANRAERRRQLDQIAASFERLRHLFADLDAPARQVFTRQLVDLAVDVVSA